MDIKNTCSRFCIAGYSLVEVLAATGIIAMGVAAAVSLSFTTTAQEESGNRIARAIAITESAARMYQLGMSGAEIIRLLPPDPVVYDISITEDAPAVSGAGALQRAVITVQYETSPGSETWDPGEWTGGPGGASSRRTLSVTSLRPTARAGAL